MARAGHRIATKSYDGELVVRHLHRHLFDLVEGTDWEPVVTAAIERDPQTAFDQVLPEHAALVASDRPDARFDAPSPNKPPSSPTPSGASKPASTAAPAASPSCSSKTPAPTKNRTSPA
jgi:hypothetical protein